MDRASTDRPMMYSLRVRRSEAYFVRIKGCQLTLATELVNAEKLTRSKAEVIQKLLMEEWGPSDLVENPIPSHGMGGE
jgi:hypothetical protein